jgi:transposase
MIDDEREVRRKLRILNHAVISGNIAKTCRHFGIPRSVFYLWRNAYRDEGEDGLRGKKPIPKSHPNRTPDDIVEKVIHLRRKYPLGSIRIMWYLARYHGIRLSESTISRILRRHGMSRLPARSGGRAVHTRRYDKQVPGHHIQTDVKFLIFKDKNGINIKRY